jgi:hypothetical protein
MQAHIGQANCVRRSWAPRIFALLTTEWARLAT